MYLNILVERKEEENVKLINSLDKVLDVCLGVICGTNVLNVNKTLNV